MDTIVSDSLEHIKRELNRKRNKDLIKNNIIIPITTIIIDSLYKHLLTALIIHASIYILFLIIVLYITNKYNSIK